MLKEIDKMEKQDFNDFDPQGLIFQVLQKTSIIIWHVQGSEQLLAGHFKVPPKL